MIDSRLVHVVGALTAGQTALLSALGATLIIVGVLMVRWAGRAPLPPPDPNDRQDWPTH